MSNANDIENEINHITSKLISSGLCSDQNWPSLVESAHRDGNITAINIDGVKELSFALRDVSYNETYSEIRKRRAFNFCLVDGGVVQLLYTFQKGALVKHNLSFYPSPDLLEFQNNQDVYSMDVLYAEVIYRNLVVTPLRIDYDPENFLDYHHPMTHLTIGQYKNCRIPSSAPLNSFSICQLSLASIL